MFLFCGFSLFFQNHKKLVLFGPNDLQKLIERKNFDRSNFAFIYEEKLVKEKINVILKAIPTVPNLSFSPGEAFIINKPY